MVHIDFGFFLQNSPGGMGFEAAPFKFTQEYLDIMGGVDSPMFEYFKSLMIRGLFEVRKHLDQMIDLIKIMTESQINTVTGQQSFVAMPCSKNLNTLEREIRERISGRYHSSSAKQDDFHLIVERIVSTSLNNNATKLYDQFQKMTNGIEP